MWANIFVHIIHADTHTSKVYLWCHYHTVFSYQSQMTTELFHRKGKMGIRLFISYSLSPKARTEGKTTFLSEDRYRQVCPVGPAGFQGSVYYSSGDGLKPSVTPEHISDSTVFRGGWDDSHDEQWEGGREGIWEELTPYLSISSYRSGKNPHIYKSWGHVSLRKATETCIFSAVCVEIKTESSLCYYVSTKK